MNSLLRADFSKQFPGGPLIRATDFKLVRPGVTVLFGPSGSGKTTVLRCLAGLETPDDGEIVFRNETWFGGGRNRTSACARPIGFVPQDYCLFPHLTVAENIAYGLHRASRSTANARVAELLQWLELGELAGRRPATLSGGQQQRVALARAVARRPELLLFDEPLAALDQPTRQRIRSELRGQLRQLGIPAVFVTHDRAEALALGDELIVMNQGRMLQRGPVPEVFSRPAGPEIAAIVGVETVQPGRVLDLQGGLATIVVGQARLAAVAGELSAGIAEVLVCIRAEDVILSGDAEAHSSARNRLPAAVRSLVSEGALVRVELDCGFPLVAVLTRQACAEMNLVTGARIHALIKAPQIHLVPRGA
jgi:molybdate transport system ATP-binding protein